MTALNFSARFAPLVASRTKRQTIRSEKSAARFKIGGLVQLYTGLRTEAARKLVEDDPVVTEIVYVGIRPSYLTLGGPGYPRIDIDEFARLDGFESYADMLAWFQATYGVETFTGRCIRWDWK